MYNLKGMTRILAILSLLVSIYTSAFAQDYYGGGNGSFRKRPDDAQQPKNKDNNPEPSGFMSINFGLAEPEGGLAAANTSAYGGYALQGTVFHFSMGFPINHSNFGIALMFGGYNNTYDNNNFARYLANTNTDPSLAEYLAPSGGINNYYSESSILGGLYFTYPIGRLSFDGRIMIGALLNGLPEQVYGTRDTAGNETDYDLQNSYPVSFAVDGGIGIRCLIARIGHRQLCAMVNVDYLFSNVSYTAQQVVDYTPSNSSIAPTEVVNSVSGSLNISMLSLTFGLGYQLGR